jgi:hypothetical protein
MSELVLFVGFRCCGLNLLPSLLALRLGIELSQSKPFRRKQTATGVGLKLVARRDQIPAHKCERGGVTGLHDSLFSSGKYIV